MCSDVTALAATTSFGSDDRWVSSKPVLRRRARGTIDLKFTNLPNGGPVAGFDSTTGYVVRQPANASTEAVAVDRLRQLGRRRCAHDRGRLSPRCTSTVAGAPDGLRAEGLVQMEPMSSSLTCGSNGTAATSTPAYSARIRFHTYSYNPLLPSAGTYGWSPWTALSGAQASDPLSTVSLTPGPGGVAVGYYGGQVRYLGEYVQGLSSQTASGFTAGTVASTDGNRMEARPNAMVSLSTVPLRPARTSPQ